MKVLSIATLFALAASANAEKKGRKQHPSTTVSRTCRVASDEVVKALGGVDGEVQVDFSNESQIRVQFSSEGVPMFRCKSSSCSAGVKRQADTYDCSNAHCSLLCEEGEGNCSNLLSAAVPSIGEDGFRMVCNDDSCSIEETQLNMFFGDVSISECREETRLQELEWRMAGATNPKLKGKNKAREQTGRTSCAILNEDINSALGGTGNAAITYDVEERSATLAFSKTSGADSVDMFACEGAQCAILGVEGLDVTYTCPEMSCSLSCEVGDDAACTGMLERVVGNVGTSGVTVTCNADTCDVNERMLNMYFGDVSCGL